MFAVIKTGGKQYRVAADDLIEIDKIAGEAGEAVSFSDVLVVGGDETLLGTPTVAGASVRGEVVEQGRKPKVIAFKKRRRKNSRRKRGHRQEFTLLRVTEILTDGAKPTLTARPTPEPKPKPVVTEPDDGDEPAESPAPKAKAAKKPAAKKADKKADKKPAKKAEKKSDKPKSGAKGKKKDDFVTKLDYITGDNGLTFRDQQRWLTKKQADHPATAATPTVSGSA